MCVCETLNSELRSVCFCSCFFFFPLEEYRFEHSVFTVLLISGDWRKVDITCSPSVYDLHTPYSVGPGKSSITENKRSSYLQLYYYHSWVCCCSEVLNVLAAFTKLIQNVLFSIQPLRFISLEVFSNRNPVSQAFWTTVHLLCAHT